MNLLVILEKTDLFLIFFTIKILIFAYYGASYPLVTMQLKLCN